MKRKQIKKKKSKNTQKSFLQKISFLVIAILLILAGILYFKGSFSNGVLGIEETAEGKRYGRLEVNIVNKFNQYSSPPSGNLVKIFPSNSFVSELGKIDGIPMGWAQKLPTAKYTIIAYPTSEYKVSFNSCVGCKKVPSYNWTSGKSSYLATIKTNKTLVVFVKFTK